MSFQNGGSRRPHSSPTNYLQQLFNEDWRQFVASIGTLEAQPGVDRRPEYLFHLHDVLDCCADVLQENSNCDNIVKWSRAREARQKLKDALYIAYKSAFEEQYKQVLTDIDKYYNYVLPLRVESINLQRGWSEDRIERRLQRIKESAEKAAQACHQAQIDLRMTGLLAEYLRAIKISKELCDELGPYIGYAEQILKRKKEAEREKQRHSENLRRHSENKKSTLLVGGVYFALGSIISIMIAALLG